MEKRLSFDIMVTFVICLPALINIIASAMNRKYDSKIDTSRATAIQAVVVAFAFSFINAPLALAIVGMVIYDIVDTKLSGKDADLGKNSSWFDVYFSTALLLTIFECFKQNTMWDFTIFSFVGLMIMIVVRVLFEFWFKKRLSTEFTFYMAMFWTTMVLSNFLLFDKVV